MHSLTSTILLMTSFLEVCIGDYKFEVLLESYINPSHKLADGSCCDGVSDYESDCDRTVCNNLFIFCVRPYGYTGHNLECPNPSQKYITSVIANDNISFADGRELNYIDANMTNPLTFEGRVWPGQVQLYTQVYNWDMFENDLIDAFVQFWSLPVSTGSYSSPQKFVGRGGHVQLTARARVMCSNNHSGPYCSVYCEEKGCHGSNDTTKFPMRNNSIKDSKSSDANNIMTVTVHFNETKQPQVGVEIEGQMADRGRHVSGSQVASIVGGILGGIMFLLLISVVVAVCLWCRTRKRDDEKQTITGQHDKQYKATVQSRGSAGLNSSSISGTYRRVDDKLYSQLPSEDRGGWSESESVNDWTVSESATALSMSNTIKTATTQANASGPISSQYSVIQRRDSDISTCHSEDDSAEDDLEHGQSAVSEPLMSQYSVITRENMDHISEASDSEDSHTYSDAEPVGNGEDVHEKSDFNPKMQNNS